jgi:hypothetical protein
VPAIAGTLELVVGLVTRFGQNLIGIFARAFEDGIGLLLDDDPFCERRVGLRAFARETLVRLFAFVSWLFVDRSGSGARGWCHGPTPSGSAPE